MSLDDHIAAWAATVRLPDADADAIFARILATAVAGTTVRSAAVPPSLAPSWWRTYNAGFAARMVASTVPARRAA